MCCVYTVWHNTLAEASLHSRIAGIIKLRYILVIDHEPLNLPKFSTAKVPYSGLISRGKFCGLDSKRFSWIYFQGLQQNKPINVECLKIFVVKISRIEQNP